MPMAKRRQPWQSRSWAAWQGRARNPTRCACFGVPAGLKKFLKKHAEGETLAVMDAKLGGLIKEKLGIPCVYSGAVMELTRGVRHQMAGLITDLAGQVGDAA